MQLSFRAVWPNFIRIKWLIFIDRVVSLLNRLCEHCARKVRIPTVEPNSYPRAEVRAALKHCADQITAQRHCKFPRSLCADVSNLDIPARVHRDGVTIVRILWFGNQLHWLTRVT